MSESVQGWILRQKGFVNYVNNNLAQRKGVIGKLFSTLKVGERQLGRHTIPKVLKWMNFYLVHTYGALGTMRPIFSRFFGVTHGPLNYTGLFFWFIATGCIMSRLKFTNGRDIMQFNQEDGAEFWYKSLNILFPANYLNNKVSAHYIEINQIYSYEMFKRYRKARRELLEERDTCSDKEKRTRYITNSHYVYEPLGQDTSAVRNVHFEQ